MPRNKILDDKNQIIDTALRLVNSEGLAAVSMRRLSKEMGVSSMTLYNYVRNVDDVLREILIRCFNRIYERMYMIMSEMVKTGQMGIAAYAKAHAMALFDFATENRDICLYMIGEGNIKFHDDAELRPFYDPFGAFLLGVENSVSGKRIKTACRLYECALLRLIYEHAAKICQISREELMEDMDIFIERMLPEERN